MAYIMVLNDEETFTDLAGCAILEVPDDFDDLDGLIDFGEATVVRVFGETPSESDWSVPASE